LVVLLTLVLVAVIIPITLLQLILLLLRHIVILLKLLGNIAILLRTQPEVIATPVRLRVWPKSWLVRAVLVIGEATVGMRVVGAVPPSRPHTTTAATLIAA
jgi:hypothetical protein